MSEVVERIEECCGLYFRSIVLQKGEKGIQHVHDHDHATFVGNGKAALRVNGIMVGIFEAGQAIHIISGQRHEFEALEDNTRLACVHDIASAESIKDKGL